jgi:SanA protein
MLAPLRSWLRRRRRVLVVLGLGALSVPLACDLLVGANVVVHVDPASVPHRRIGLVLGTSPLHEGRPNRFYEARLDAAAALYHAGAVDGLLVSGDNRRHDYNEPDAMRADLVARGVPLEHVTCDYAGFRTLDSVVRARHVFGLDAVTIVSQPFHTERAVFLARAHGLDALAFGAADPALRSWLKVRTREVGARMLAVLDGVVGTEPHFLGEPVAVAARERLVR